MSCNVPGDFYSGPGALIFGKTILIFGKTILRNALALSGDQVLVSMPVNVVTVADVSRKIGTAARA